MDIANMMTTYERQQTILRLLEEQPGIKVVQLANMLNVSEGTIRNDLNALEAEKRIKRVRGGAVLLDTPEKSDLPKENISNAEAKERIAHWAAEMVEDGDAILLDASTTVRSMVPHLQPRQNLTIVTNGLETARLLAVETTHTIILIGGIVSPDGAATTSQMSIEIIENLHIRTAFVSGVGFTLEKGLTERNIEEAQLKQTLLASAQRTVVLLDSTKIGKVGFAPLAPISKISNLLTDSEVSNKFIEQVRDTGVNLLVCGENTVRSYTAHDDGKTKFTLGFANQSEELPFAIDVRRSLERAASNVGNIDLVVADNRLSGEEALRVADKLIQRDIDLAIEYQIDYKAGNLIMNKFQQANIPVIAVDIPIVGATFFGVDNYRAGHMAGAALGEWVEQNWNGRIDHLFILEEPRAGSLPEARIQGQLDGLQDYLGQIPVDQLHYIDCGNVSAVSETGVVERLQTMPDCHHIAIISFNDEAAYGALQAARKNAREADVVIVGQGADRLIHSELRNPNSRLIGSTAYMPERYGEKLMDLALKILRGESVPPAVYMSHVFINAENIDRFYPASD